MLADYFPESSAINARLEELIGSEISRRTSLGLDSPNDVSINVILEESRLGGNAEKINGAVVVHLNVLNEILNNPELYEKYKSKLEEIDQWVINTRPLVAPGRLQAIGIELLEVLKNPDSLDIIDITTLSPEAQTHYEQAHQYVKEKAPVILEYVTEMLQDIVNQPLAHMQSTLRHEIEHFNPRYRAEIEAMHAKEQEILQIVENYQRGQRPISTRSVRRIVKEYLDIASQLFPDEEVRAHMVQYFDPESDSKETLKQKEDYVAGVLATEYVPNNYRPLIVGMVAKKALIEAANQGTELDLNTLHHVENVVFQGTKYPADSTVELDRVDRKLADNMLREIGFWENKFREGIMVSLDRAESFYQSNLKK